MPDCRFEEYFLPATPETTFGDETLAGPNLSARRTQSGGIPTDSMTSLVAAVMTSGRNDVLIKNLLFCLF